MLLVAALIQRSTVVPQGSSVRHRNIDIYGSLMTTPRRTLMRYSAGFRVYATGSAASRHGPESRRQRCPFSVIRSPKNGLNAGAPPVGGVHRLPVRTSVPRRSGPAAGNASALNATRLSELLSHQKPAATASARPSVAWLPR